MLFFAWTSIFFSYLLLWVSQIIFVLQWKSFFRCFLWSSAITWRLNCSFLPDFFLRKTWFQNLKKIICSFQYLYSVFNDLSLITTVCFSSFLHFRFLSGGGNLPLVGSNLESLSAYIAYTLYKHSALSYSLLFAPRKLSLAWWAQVDSNHRPRAYQARALTCWAMSPFSLPMYLVHLFRHSCEAFASGGDDGIRTHDPLLAGQVLSQLSYTPI